MLRGICSNPLRITVGHAVLHAVFTILDLCRICNQIRIHLCHEAHTPDCEIYRLLQFIAGHRTSCNKSIRQCCDLLCIFIIQEHITGIDGILAFAECICILDKCIDSLSHIPNDGLCG